MLLIALGIAAGVVGLSFISGIRIFKEYERGILFRLGKANKLPIGPGIKFLLPFGIDRVQTVDTRTKVCLLYTSPSPRDRTRSRMPSSA